MRLRFLLLRQPTLHCHQSHFQDVHRRIDGEAEPRVIFVDMVTKVIENPLLTLNTEESTPLGLFPDSLPLPTSPPTLNTPGGLVLP